MFVDQLHPKVENRVDFSLASLGVTPEVAGCYVLSSFQGDILYIGKTKSLHKRLEQHCNDLEKQQRSPVGVVQFMYYRVCSAAEMTELERAWTAQFAMRNKGALPHFARIWPGT